MTDSIREKIIQAIETKLALIRTANGYHTDCGANIDRVRKKFDPDELPAIAVWPKPDTDAEPKYGSQFQTMPVQIEALKHHGTENPSKVSEKILADLMECVLGVEWSVDFTFGGTYEIEVGDTVTGAASGATAYVAGVSLSSGSWAGGDAAGTLTLRRLSGSFGAENLNVGAQTNIATIAAAPTGTGPIDTTTGGLAEAISYESGGTNDYPDAGDGVTGVQVVFNVQYKTITGNPYARE